MPSPISPGDGKQRREILMALKLVVNNKEIPDQKTYSVPVSYELSGEIVVKACSKEEALKVAKEIYSTQGVGCIEVTCVDVDFALGEDDENHVEEVE